MRILFVENHEAFATTLISAFPSHHIVRVVPSVEAAKTAADSCNHDVILADFALDHGKDPKAIAHVRRKKKVPSPSSPCHRTPETMIGSSPREPRRPSPKKLNEIDVVLKNISSPKFPVSSAARLLMPRHDE